MHWYSIKLGYYIVNLVLRMLKFLSICLVGLNAIQSCTHVFPKLQRDATDGDLDAAEEATEEEEATVFKPLDEGSTEAVTEEVDAPIPLEMAPG